MTSNISPQVADAWFFGNNFHLSQWLYLIGEAKNPIDLDRIIAAGTVQIVERSITPLKCRKLEIIYEFYRNQFIFVVKT